MFIYEDIANRNKKAELTNAKGAMASLSADNFSDIKGAAMIDKIRVPKHLLNKQLLMSYVRIELLISVWACVSVCACVRLITHKTTLHKQLHVDKNKHKHGSG